MMSRQFIPSTALALAACAGALSFAACEDDRPLLSGIALDVAPPARLSETGLYSDLATRTVDPQNLPFSPQYPLWTDGAAKRRWIRLPPGQSIDATQFNDWTFPVGTRLWKEFAFGVTVKRAVETRYMERLADGRWLLAAYVWDADGKDASLAPDRGVRSIPVESALVSPATSARHDVPSRLDCTACHGARATPVLGFNALQLSPDRDPLAPHAEPLPPGAVDLRTLLADGRVRTRREAWPEGPPRIAARSPKERAALGYLQSNCATCHRDAGDLAALRFTLEAKETASTLDSFDSAQVSRGHRVPAPLSSVVDVPARFRFPGEPLTVVPRVAARDPERSAIVRRMASRVPPTQMPPLGTRLVDREGLDLVRAWIREDVGLDSPDLPTASNPRSKE